MRTEWLDRINPQLHLVWHGAWRAGLVEPLRTLMDHELVLFTKGRCVVEVGQESFDCPADSFIIVPPGRLHITRNAAAPCYRHCFHFDWDYWGPNPKPPVFVFSPTGFGREQLRLAPGFVPPGVWHGRFAQSPAALTLVQTLEFEWLAGRRGACRPRSGRAGQTTPGLHPGHGLPRDGPRNALSPDQRAR
jgi:AraC family transcriptional regulator of arabinose operon